MKMRTRRNAIMLIGIVLILSTLVSASSVCSTVPFAANTTTTPPLVLNCTDVPSVGFVAPLQGVCMVHSDQQYSVLEQNVGSVVCDSCSSGVSGHCIDTLGKFSHSKLDTVTVCSQEIPEMLECPLSHPAVIATCGTLSSSCLFRSERIKCQYFGILCGNSLQASEKMEIVGVSACDWVPFSNDFSARCEVNEVVSGMCISEEQSRCQGAAYGGRVKCCLVKKPGCIDSAANKIWKHISSAERCSIGTSVEAVCSVRCDPVGYFGVKNNEGMISCGYNGFTRRVSGVWESGCDNFPRCPAGHVMVSFSQCLSPTTIIKCEQVAYGSIDEKDCVTLSGDDVLTCPKGYRGKALCAPNRIRFCPGGVDTVLECCRVRSYDNFGTPCTSGYVSTLVGGGSSADVELGTTAGDLLQTTSIGQPLSVGTCGKSSAVFVSTSNHTVIRVSLEQWRVEKFVGVFNSPGYIDSAWTPASWVSNTNINTPVAVAPVGDNQCMRVFELESKNRIVKQIREAVGSPNYFQYSAAGHQGQLGNEILANYSKDYRAALGNVTAIAYRKSYNELYIATYGAVLMLDEVNGRVIYFFGDGFTQGPKASDGSRHTRKLFHPKALAFQADQVLYIADHDGVSSIGYISIVDMKTGGISLVDNLEPCIPNSLAIFQDYIMYYTAVDRHCVYFSYLTASASGILTGSCVGTGGYLDYVSFAVAEYNYPQGLATDDLFLYIADTGNSRVRRAQLEQGVTVCSSEGYDPNTGCTSCLAGYGGYPSCRKTCTVADDCNYRASSVSGVLGSCVCSCHVGWALPSCSRCIRGLDLRTNCTLCAKGYQNYPRCRTSTETLTWTETLSGETPESSVSPTLTPPPTPTKTMSMETPSLEGITETVTPERTLTRVRSESETFNESNTIGKTFTKKASATFTLSLTETVTMTNTLEQSQTPELLSTPTSSYSQKTPSRTSTHSSVITFTDRLTISDEEFTLTGSLSHTITPPPTETPTSSWPLILPTVVVENNLFPNLNSAISRDYFNSDTATSRQLTLHIRGDHFDLSEIPRVVAREEDKILAEVLSAGSDVQEELLQRKPYLDRFSRICIEDLYVLYVPLNSTKVDSRMSDYALRLAVRFNRTKEDVLESLSREVIARQFLAFQDSVMVERLKVSFLNAKTVSHTEQSVIVEVEKSNGNFYNRDELFLHIRLAPGCFHGKFGPEEPVVVRVIPLPPPPELSSTVRIAVTAVAGFWTLMASSMFHSSALFIFFGGMSAYDLAECLNVPPTGPLPWFIHPFHFPVGHDDDPLRFYNSAMIMMTCVPILVLFIHFVIAHFQSEEVDAASTRSTTTRRRETDGELSHLHDETRSGGRPVTESSRRRTTVLSLSPLQACLIRFRFPSYSMLILRWCCIPAVFCATTVASYRGKMQLVAYAVLILWAIYVVLTFAFFRSLLAAVFERYTIVDRPRGMKRFVVPYGYWRDALISSSNPSVDHDSSEHDQQGSGHVNYSKKQRSRHLSSESPSGIYIAEEEYGDDDDRSWSPAAASSSGLSAEVHQRTGFCRRWSPIYQTLRPYGLSIVPLDAALSYLLAVIHGVYYGLSTTSSCMSFAAIEIIICTIELVCLIWLRPFSVPLANVGSVLGVGLIVSSLAVVLMREELNESNEDDSFLVAVWLALGGAGIFAQVVLSLSVFFTLISAAMEWWAREVDTILVKRVDEVSAVALGPTAPHHFHHHDGHHNRNNPQSVVVIRSSSSHSEQPEEPVKQQEIGGRGNISWSIWDRVVPPGYPFLADTQLPISLLPRTDERKMLQWSLNGQQEQQEGGVLHLPPVLHQEEEELSPIASSYYAGGDSVDRTLRNNVMKSQGDIPYDLQQHRRREEIQHDDESEDELQSIRRQQQQRHTHHDLSTDVYGAHDKGAPVVVDDAAVMVSELMAASDETAIPSSWKQQQHSTTSKRNDSVSPLADTPRSGSGGAWYKDTRKKQQSNPTIIPNREALHGDTIFPDTIKYQKDQIVPSPHRIQEEHLHSPQSSTHLTDLIARMRDRLQEDEHTPVSPQTRTKQKSSSGQNRSPSVKFGDVVVVTEHHL